jgi:hypothetical protein
VLKPQKLIAKFLRRLPLCVAHSWKVFSGMLQKLPRSGITASAVTVAYALNALELVPFVGVELQLSAWYQVCCTLPSGLLGPALPVMRLWLMLDRKTQWLPPRRP